MAAGVFLILEFDTSGMECVGETARVGYNTAVIAFAVNDLNAIEADSLRHVTGQIPILDVSLSASLIGGFIEHGFPIVPFINVVGVQGLTLGIGQQPSEHGLMHAQIDVSTSHVHELREVRGMEAGQLPFQRVGLRAS